ncbi:MAG: two-component sensor histidine kinase, partial [Bacteroides sp.]|nr:two-component sensor histidine kinase [Bacteroides sp.]
MALSFMSLLYLQVVYVEEMIKTRREQFDAAVRSSLEMVAKDVEYNETLKWLQEEFNDMERRVLVDNDTPLKQSILSGENNALEPQKKLDKTEFEVKRSKVDPKDLPKALVAPYAGGGIIPKTNEEIRKEMRQVYLYQRTILEEVVWKIIYRVRNKSVEDRVEYDQLNSSIRYNLYRNGITLPYYFVVVNRNGKEVYSCNEFDFRGNEDAYTQELFREGQSHRKILLKIHFPDKKNYIFSSIDFMIPSLIFTMVLLLTFIFTIYIIFRQKKLSEM